MMSIKYFFFFGLMLWLTIRVQMRVMGDYILIPNLKVLSVVRREFRWGFLRDNIDEVVLVPLLVIRAHIRTKRA